MVPGCAGAGSTISPAFTPFLVNPAESGWHESIETIEIQLVNLIVYFFKLGVPDVLLDANIFSVIHQFKLLIIRFCTSWRHFPPQFRLLVPSLLGSNEVTSLRRIKRTRCGIRELNALVRRLCNKAYSKRAKPRCEDGR